MNGDKKNTIKIPIVFVYIFLFLIFSNPIFLIPVIIVGLPFFIKILSKNNIKTQFLKSDGKVQSISIEYISKLGSNTQEALPVQEIDAASKKEGAEIEDEDSSLEQLTNTVVQGESKKLDRKKKYLQIALNNDLNDAEQIISSIPTSDRIIIEAGTPLIKKYGIRAIERIKELSPDSYIVADSKVSDLADREVEMMSNAGASAITCLGVAPIETINVFLDKCKEYDVESMIDMMNVEDPIFLLKKLKRIPDVVIVHRGVDETNNKTEKIIPYYQIKQIKGNYNIMVSIAGGDSENEIGSAIFNGANIVVLWKKFFQSDSAVKELTEGFLKIIK